MKHRRQHKGIVCGIHDEKGFGYIIGELPSQFQDQNVFFFTRNVYRGPINVGDAVEFSLDGKSNNGLRTESVWLINKNSSSQGGDDENVVLEHGPDKGCSERLFHCKEASAGSFRGSRKHLSSDTASSETANQYKPSNQLTTNQTYQSGNRRSLIFSGDDEAHGRVVKEAKSLFLSKENNIPDERRSSCERKSSNVSSETKQMIALDKDHRPFRPPVLDKPLTSGIYSQTGYRRSGFVPQSNDGSKCNSGFPTGSLGSSQPLSETSMATVRVKELTQRFSTKEKHVLDLETRGSDHSSISKRFSSRNLIKNNQGTSGSLTSIMAAARLHSVSQDIKSSLHDELSGRLVGKDQTNNTSTLSGCLSLAHSMSLSETPVVSKSSNTAVSTKELKQRLSTRDKNMLAGEGSRSDDITNSNAFFTMNLRNKDEGGSDKFTKSTSTLVTCPRSLSPNLKSSSPEQISHGLHSMSKTSTPSKDQEGDHSPKRPRKGRVVTLKDHFGFIKPFANEMPLNFAKKYVYFAKRALSSGDIKVNDEVEFQLDMRNEEKPSAKRVWSLKDINENNQNDKDMIDETFSTIDAGISGGSKRIKSVKESRLSKNKGDSISGMDDSTIDSQAQSNTQNRAASVGFSIQQQIPGRICSLKDGYGFIRPSDKLPEDYPQSKDVHFYLNKLSCGLMQLSTGDEVEFTLGTKDKDRPMAIKLQITRFRRRNVTEIRKYLESVGGQLDDLKSIKEGIIDGMKMDANAMSTSEFFVTLLTCLPAWNCVFSCTNLNDKDVQLLLTLILEIEELCPLEAIFQKAIKVLSDSKFFSVIRGRFKDFIAELVKPLASEDNCFGCKFMHNLL